MPPAFPCCRRTGECNPLSWSLPGRCLHKRQKRPLPPPFRGHSCWFLCAALPDAEARGPVHVRESQTPRGQLVRAGSQSFPVSIVLVRDISRRNIQVEFHGSKGTPLAVLCGRTDRLPYSRIAERACRLCRPCRTRKPLENGSPLFRAFHLPVLVRPLYEARHAREAGLAL